MWVWVGPLPGANFLGAAGGVFVGNSKRFHGARCLWRHVKMGQSSNDVIPSSIRISVTEELKNHLVPPVEKLHDALEAFLAPAIDSPKYPDQQLDQEAT